jgi:hypothetical protein
MEQIYQNFWILFTANGELAIDTIGILLIGDNPEYWIKQMNILNPEKAPYIAIEYKPNLVK